MIRLFRVFVPVGILTLLLSEITLITSFYILATYLVLNVDPTVFLLYDGGLLRIAVLLVSILMGLHFEDLYTRVQVKSRIFLFQQFCEVIGAALLVQGLLSYSIPELVLPRSIMLIGSALTLVFLPLWRQIYSSRVIRAVGGQRILFVGHNAVIGEIAAHIRSHSELNFLVLGYVSDEPEPPAGGKVLGAIENLRAVAERTRPDLIVVGMSERRQRMPVQELLHLRFAGFRIEEASSTYETICGRICSKELRPAQLIFSGELGPRRGFRLQAPLNFLLALFGIAVSFPLMLLTAALVRLSSPGPIFLSQSRVGFNGSVFRLYKFRSMYADAEKTTGAVWAAKDDPRITPIGKWLRKIRLDELPQLFNVLKGEMSIVGPRPERPEFVEVLAEKIPYYPQRHAVKPGITGWAQINYRYGDTLEDAIVKLEYDLYYIKHLSFSLDTYIVFHTLKTMLLLRGGQ